MRSVSIPFALILLGVAPLSALAADDNPLPPVTERFAKADIAEEPDFQRHVSPLLGRLGCNGRACHGSFQGRGGFRLSLFGYDFKADHEALTKAEKDKTARIDLEKPDESLIIVKPTDADVHEGGLRYERGSWEHHLVRRWIETGAKFDGAEQKLVRLEITPSELIFKKPGETKQLKAVAVWANGAREDVTPLCRFQSNNDQICAVTENGLVTSSEPGDSHVVIFYDKAVLPIPVMQPVSPLAGKKYPKVPTPTKIDELVVAKLRKLGIVPSELASDAEFLRRVSIDLIGTLPTAGEVEAFLQNESPNKRQEKVDELLATPAYAAWWTTKLCDFTGNSETQINNNIGPTRSSTQEWYDWIYKRVAENVPYDQIAEGIVLAVSRKPDQSYLEYCEQMSKIYHKDSEATYAELDSLTHFWNRRNLRQPEDRAIGFAYTFLGVRIQCAQCHKHPFDQWSKQDFEDFKAFFTGLNIQANGRDKKEYEALMEELGLKGMKGNGNDIRKKLGELLKEGKTVPFPEVYPVAAQKPTRDKKGKQQPRGRVATKARLLGSEELDLTEYEDIREPLMAWLRAKDNPYFARAFVNRVWANYFNVGIVQPPDDLSLANPPSNKPLLDYLTQGFIEHGFDMKWLHREIIASRTYQLTWQPNETNAKDETNFSRAVPRRIPAEAAYDAVQMATASDERANEFKSDLKTRAIAVAGVNGAGAKGNATFALQVFGRSIRESNCDCDRSSEASLLQTVYLQNDANILSAIQGGKGSWIDEVSRQLSGAGTGSKSQRPKESDLKKEIAQLKVRLDKAKKKEDEEQVKRLKDRLADLTQTLKDASDEQEKEGEAVEKRQLPPEQSAALVKQLYLRTVSRYPTAAEMDRCHEFLADAATHVEGLRGLMWALINTKEFIVNH
jgi:hypothetical protein